MPSPESTDQARLLLRKAAGDEAVVELDKEEQTIAKEIIGFHAQQAVEKLLKAVLASRGVDFPWTHDLRHLMELLDEAGVPPPENVVAAKELTPWAAEFRYGEDDDEELDRAQALEIIGATRAWATAEIERHA